MADDTLGIPTSYLQSYPYPAIALRPAVRTSSTPAASSDNASYPRAAWANKRWLEIVGNLSLHECIRSDRLAELSNWLDSAWQESQVEFELTLTRPPIGFRMIKARATAESSTLSRNLVILTAVNGGSPILEQPSTPPTRSSPCMSPLSSPQRRPRPAPGPSGLRAMSIGEGAADCLALLEALDWSKTPLGARSSWSPVIETMIDVVMRSPTQDALWLGPEFTMVYNQHYSQIVHHPIMFGSSAKRPDAWGPVWDGVAGLIDNCLTKGESVYKEDDLLLYRRGPKGHFIEKYHSWSFIPVFDADGTPLGLYNPTIETTAAVLAKRRQETLRDISENINTVQTAQEFYSILAETVTPNAKDIPFLMCYSVSISDKGDARLHLQSTVGVPVGHPGAPSVVECAFRGHQRLSSSLLPVDRGGSPTSSASTITDRFVSSGETTSWPFNKLLHSRQGVVVEDCKDIVQGFELREWDHLPESAIMLPISGDHPKDIPVAILVLGLNLRCPLDEQYADWLQVMRSHLRSALVSVRARERQQQRILEEERMARAKTAWFQGAAHDLRTPLTLVAGPLDDALHMDLTPRQRAPLVTAQRNVARIQRLVDTLLDFSRIEAGKLQGQFIALDLTRFIGDLTALFQPAMMAKQLEFVVELQKHDGVVYVDPTLFETAFTNILSNALKYTASGKITVTLVYGIGVELAISDTGVGIPEDEILTVTDRFKRATTAITSGVEGTGIGLALTNEIIRLHNGTMAIQSSTGATTHGSTFTIRIPLTERISLGPQPAMRNFGTYGRQLVQEAMDVTAMQAEGPTTLSRRGSSDDGWMFKSTDTLLLVDDNLEVRRYIRQIFAPHCRVIEACDGYDALETLKSKKPDLILSDLMMPRMNGTQLMETVRADPDLRSIPFMLLSAATDEELRLSAFAAGAEDFMLKPFKPRELLAKVHLHMQIGKRRRELESLFAQRERELAILSDFCPSGIVRADREGIVTYANAAWREICGMPADADANSWDDYHLPAERARLVGVWQDIIAGDERDTTLTWTWRNGRTVQGRFLRLDFVDDRMRGILGCVQDITHQEERVKEADRRRVEAEEARREQELLVDVTSHEIRTPVSAILQCSSLVKGNLEGLRQFLDTGSADQVMLAEFRHELEEDIQALESIYQCGLQQERIASDILSLAQSQLDLLSIHDTDMDIKVEATKTISIFSAEAKSKQIRIALEIGESLSQTGVSVIKTDAVRLRQVITNLMSNAIRFTANSTRRLITVRFDVSMFPPDGDSCALPTVIGALSGRVRSSQPAWLFIYVADSGPGLSTLEQSVLFKRFSQGNSMIHSRFGGSGLGLFICKKITELLGGRIECVSELGKGSTFRLFIQGRVASRMCDIPAVTLETFGSEVDKPKIAPEKTPSPCFDQPHVLIVEDNLINQTVLKRQLVKNGWICDVASDGQQALTTLRAARLKSGEEPPYDVVLMDIEMPIMDGMTAVKHLRDEEVALLHCHQVVYALTGNAREGQVERILAAGMDDIILKPYKLPELLAKIQPLAGLRGRARSNGV